LSDFVSVGVLADAVPGSAIAAVLNKFGKASRRQRDLPAAMVVYYVMALALYMQCSCREVLRCLLEGLHWLLNPGGTCEIAGPSGISQARERLGWEPLQALHDELVQPIASRETRGAWYRHWRLVSLDGSTLEAPDTRPNVEAFGRPSNQKGAGGYPQIRFVAIGEIGTHVLFNSRMGAYRAAETTLAEQVLPGLRSDMLCLADRQFLGYQLWQKAQANGAALLWRASKTFLLACQKRLADGSYSSSLYASAKDRRRGRNGIPVRVIEYRLPGVAQAEPLYRLVTTILDPEQAPAQELAPLYHERWELETALDELKTHLRGGRVVLRSKIPDLVRQEFYGLLLTHFAIRRLMHQAALRAGEDPDRLSYTHTVRIARRRLPQFAAIPPSAHPSSA
jgi:hypothetical protein